MLLDIRLALCALILLLTTIPGFAEPVRVEIVVSSSSPSYGQWILSGCTAAASKWKGGCDLNQKTGSEGVMVQVQRLDALINQKSFAGIALQVDDAGFVSALVPVLEAAKRAGVPVVAWSGVTLEHADLILNKTGANKLVVTTVGVPQVSLVENLAKSTIGDNTKGGSFCLVTSSYLASDGSFEELVKNTFVKGGMAVASGCPLQIDDYNQLSDKIIELVRRESVKAFLLPFYISPDSFKELTKDTKEVKGEDTLFVSAWANPFDLGLASAEIINKVLPGESVPEKLALAPVIEISSQQYCDSCSCTSDERCGRECRKCQK
jgi:hypothetical protein